MNQKGRPKPVIRHDELNALVERNPRTTVRKIGSELQTSPATVSRHLKKIGKVKKIDRVVTHQLNDIQRNRSLTVAKPNYEILAHPPYSPDIFPTDYHIFKHFELAIRNKTFLNKEEVIETFEQFISVKADKFFEDGIYAVGERWMKVTNEQGSYFD
eukprot:XP_014785717.1 PREDICTED: histone-lysine N-methyltransferase SETMAR-like [Octopus bimaculoides]